MKEKIIFVFFLVLLISAQGISQQDAKKNNVETEIRNLENVFGNSFYKALYSIDELRPYSIIQIDKIAQMYDNNWISPKAIVAKLNHKDKEVLISGIVDYITNLEVKKSEKNILNKIKAWCVAENQLNLIAKKIGIGRTNVLKIIMNYLPSPINSNTGEIIINDKASTNEEYYYYATINQLSNLKPKELYHLFSNIFGELAQK